MRLPHLLSLGLLAMLAMAASRDGACAADPAPPTHEEIESLRIDLGSDGKIKTMAMTPEGNLLLGVGSLPDNAGRRSMPPSPIENLTPEQRRNLSPEERRRLMAGRGRPYTGDPDDSQYVYTVKTVSPDGKVLATWLLPEGIEPHMLCATASGYTYVMGGGKLAAFRTATGELVRSIDTATLSPDQDLASGICVGEKEGERYVFVALGSGRSLRAEESIYRLNLDLSGGKKIIETQYGCCGHIDLEVRDGVLLVAENSRHRVNRFDLEGNPLGTWGKRDRTDEAGFAACCNPVNVDFGPDGVLYAAESGIGRVKRYTPQGEYLGMVGHVDTTEFDGGSALAAQSCYIPVEVSPDGTHIYVMDVRAHIVRVLAPKKS